MTKGSVGRWIVAAVLGLPGVYGVIHAPVTPALQIGTFTVPNQIWGCVLCFAAGYVLNPTVADAIGRWVVAVVTKTPPPAPPTA